MKELKEGLTFEVKEIIGENKTVPHIYPEFEETKVMPEVFATGFMVGLFECSCIRFLKDYINWPEEMTVGIGINFSHLAPTPPGFVVTVKGTLVKVEGKKLTFKIEAYDGVDKISEGDHKRFIINAAKFNEQVKIKAGKHS